MTAQYSSNKSKLRGLDHHASADNIIDLALYEDYQLFSEIDCPALSHIQLVQIC